MSCRDNITAILASIKISKQIVNVYESLKNQARTFKKKLIYLLLQGSGAAIVAEEMVECLQ